MQNINVQQVEIKVLNSDMTNLFSLPSYSTDGAAAMDLRAFFSEDTDDSLFIHPDHTKLISCGFSMHLNDGTAGLILPRSGLGIKHGIVLRNSVGLIDSDYQGEIKVGLKNTSGKIFTVKHGDRIAQLMIVPYITVDFKKVSNFSVNSFRGEGGFGSTGVS